MEVLGGSIQWNVCFVKEAHDWEVDVFASFQVLHSAMVSRDRADRLWWVPSKKGVFKVKSFFSFLVGFEGRHFPWKRAWQTQAPSRVAFFAWTAALGKILTVDNLKKRKIIIVDRCYLCKRDGESVDHLLLHCDVASTFCGIMFFLGLVCLELCLEELSTYLLLGRRLEGQGVLRYGRWSICILWCVWKERNLRRFEYMENSLEDIVVSFLHMLYLWTVTFLSPLSISYSDFLFRFSLPS
jgi:hypothetical protein